MLSCVIRGLDNLKENTGALKQTVKEANDAETIAHDALASIDARAVEITSNMAEAQVKKCVRFYETIAD